MKTLREKNQRKHKQWQLNQKEQKQQLLAKKKKHCDQKMAESNSKLLLSGKFDSDPEEILDKSLLFNLKKTSVEKHLIWDLKKYQTKTIFLTLSIGREQRI